MTREEIKNTPEIVDFMLSESVMSDSKEKLHKRLDEICNLAIKTLEQESILDKLRAEIESKYGQCDICEFFEDYDYEENDISEYRPIGNITDILQIIDNCKVESEVEDGECK